jgi:pyruvate dehydrogenase E1 component beta subunit
LFLQAPVERVTAPDAVVPLLRLEKTYMPGEKQIADAVRRAVRYA